MPQKSLAPSGPRKSGPSLGRQFFKSTSGDWILQSQIAASSTREKGAAISEQSLVGDLRSRLFPIFSILCVCAFLRLCIFVFVSLSLSLICLKPSLGDRQLFNARLGPSVGRFRILEEERGAAISDQSHVVDLRSRCLNSKPGCNPTFPSLPAPPFCVPLFACPPPRPYAAPSPSSFLVLCPSCSEPHAPLSPAPSPSPSSLVAPHCGASRRRFVFKHVELLRGTSQRVPQRGRRSVSGACGGFRGDFRSGLAPASRMGRSRGRSSSRTLPTPYKQPLNSLKVFGVLEAILRDFKSDYVACH